MGAQAHELLEALSDLLACPFFYDTILSEINLGQHAFIILNGLLKGRSGVIVCVLLGRNFGVFFDRDFNVLVLFIAGCLQLFSFLSVTNLSHVVLILCEPLTLVIGD